MKEYLNLCLQGESTIILRKEMLSKKQEALRASIKELKTVLPISIGSRIFTMKYFPASARM